MGKSSFYVVLLFIISIGAILALREIPTNMFTEGEMTFLWLGAFMVIALTVIGSFKVMLK